MFSALPNTGGGFGAHLRRLVARRVYHEKKIPWDPGVSLYHRLVASADGDRNVPRTRREHAGRAQNNGLITTKTEKKK